MPSAHIFFAPESMRAGGFWLPQLAKEIAQSTAFVLLVGEKGVGPWQVIEYYEALDRRVKEPNYPLILVLSEKRAGARSAVPAPAPLDRYCRPGLRSDDRQADAMPTSGPAPQPGELWRHTRPYRGLEAMTEADSDFFFGRERETVEVINALASERGKLARPARQFRRRQIVAGAGRRAGGALAPSMARRMSRMRSLADGFRSTAAIGAFSRCGREPSRSRRWSSRFWSTWQFEATDPSGSRSKTVGSTLLRDGKATLPDLLDATERRYNELGQPQPSAFFLYIDQGEELYVRAEKQQRRRFSEIVAQRACRSAPARADEPAGGFLRRIAQRRSRSMRCTG